MLVCNYCKAKTHSKSRLKLHAARDIKLMFRACAHIQVPQAFLFNMKWEMGGNEIASLLFSHVKCLLYMTCPTPSDFHANAYRKIDLYIKSEYLTLTYWDFEKKRERARERWREMYNSPYPDLNANKWTLYARQLFYLCCCQWFLTIKWCVYIWYIYFFFARARTTQTRWMWFLLLLCEKCESCWQPICEEDL